MSEDSKIIDWLRLINTEGIGAVGFAKYISAYGSATCALDFLTSRGKKVPSVAWAQKEMEHAFDLNVHILLKDDELYPQQLLSLKDAPPVLYAKGNLNLTNSSPTIAIVGSRNASLNSYQLTQKIAFDLSEQQVLVISGMARGIDSAAHNGALTAQNGKGTTIAVLGTGIDQIYPPENKNLYNKIAEQGLLLSEMPFESAALTGSFPRRNRIVAGMSCGVLITEASEKSGSLITARYATEQHKTLFAVPGSPSDARAGGTNALLRSGACWAENAQDVLKVIKSPTFRQTAPCMHTDFGDLFTKPLDNSVKTTDIPTCSMSGIEAFLSTDPVDIDEIIRYSQLDTATVSMQLLDLEMQGKIIRLPGNKISLNGNKEKEHKQ